MAGDSYIRVIFESNGTSEEGRKLYLNIEPLRRNKGIPTVDAPIPTLKPSNRILIPAGGNQDDIELNCLLFEESSKVAANISSEGTETDRTDVRTIKEQWDFVFDEIMEFPDSASGGIFAIYELYLAYNDQTYRGWLQASSPINHETYTGEVEVRLTFKVGKNPIAFLI
jgi:hypothetical protein